MNFLSRTHSLMKLNPSWEAANCSATQEVLSTSRNPKVHYRAHKDPPLVPILSQIDSVNTIPSYLSQINFNVVHPPTSCLSSGLFPSGLPTNILYGFIVFPFVLVAPPISSSLASSFWFYLAKSTSCETPRYVFFSKLPLFQLSSIQIFSSTPCSQTPSVYVSPLIIIIVMCISE
jgi:hypothetical protein